MPSSLNPSSVFQGFFPLCSQGHTSSTGYPAHRQVWLSTAGIYWEWCRRSAPGCCQDSASGFPCPSRGSGGSGTSIGRRRSGGGGHSWGIRAPWTLVVTQEARPAPTLRLLRRRWRWCLGDGSGLVSSKKLHQSPSPVCCPAPTRSLATLGQQFCGSGRRLRLSTSASATSAPN
jgi:hypothetical protein